MKKFLNIFFVTLGVIFFILILLGGYLFVTDPFDLKPILFSSDTVESVGELESAPIEDKNPALSPTQEKALETFGVDPAAIPSSITPAQEACFIEVLGKARVDEIKAGDSPSATEFFKAKGCI